MPTQPPSPSAQPGDLPELDVDFALSPSQERVRDMAVGAIERITANSDDPVMLGRGSLSSCFTALAEANLLGLMAPTADGGAGLGWLEHAVALGELADLRSGLAVAYHGSQVAMRLARNAEITAATLGGTGFAMLAHREAHSTDDYSVSTVATRVGDGYQLSGAKKPVVIVPNIRWLLVTARLENGVGLFRVEPGRAGCSITEVPAEGLLACPLASIGLDAVEIESDALLCQWDTIDDVAGVLLRDMYATRVVYDLRSATHALNFVVDDAKKKWTFGRPLLRWQAIQFRLLDAQSHLDLLEPMAWYYLWALDTGHVPPTAIGASTVAYAALLHRQTMQYTGRAYEDAVEIGGGRTFNREHPVWQRYMSYLAARSLDNSEWADDRLLGEQLMSAQFS